MPEADMSPTCAASATCRPTPSRDPSSAGRPICTPSRLRNKEGPMSDLDALANRMRTRLAGADIARTAAESPQKPAPEPQVESQRVSEPGPLPVELENNLLEISYTGESELETQVTDSAEYSNISSSSNTNSETLNLMT